MPAKLFTPVSFKNVTIKNRIVMSPMCMYSCEKEDGMVEPFHLTHYESRAAGQAGLIMVEATAVQQAGRISARDLGIWHDGQIDGLKRISQRVHAHGAKSSIQLAHAGRKAQDEERIYAPSPLAFSENYQKPLEMSETDISDTVQAFQQAADRARKADFDIIEIHGAHGYLINQFLSPLSNKRTDQYGGSLQNRFRLLESVIQAVKKVWTGPLFVRLSADEYHPDGNQLDDFLWISARLKELDVDLIDCSSGGLIPASVPVYPGYQVPLAEKIKQETGIATGAVGLITTGIQAEEILQNERADVIFLARALLRNPYWAKAASDELGYKELEAPKQYIRGWK